MVEDSVRGKRRRLKQLKKILPSDHISIEKNFPRFYQKCQQMKLQKQTSKRIDNICNESPFSKTNQDQLSDEISDRLRLEQDLENEENNLKMASENTTTIEMKNQKNGQHLPLKYSLTIPANDFTMADHLEEMTLQRGCWLQATIRGYKTNKHTFNFNEKSPKIVFTHRKKNNDEATSPTSRVQLALEVLNEFDRQKQLLKSNSSNRLYSSSLSESNIYLNSILSRSVQHLQSRRVS